MKKFILSLSAMLPLVFLSVLVNAQTTTCLPPTNLTASNITNVSATLNWTPSSSSNQYYTVQFRPPGTSAWTTVTVQQIPYTLGNLLCGTTYEWQVQAYCINPNGLATPSGYSLPVNFATLACTSTCNPPSGITATNITTNGATISWGAVTGASGYNVRYRIAGAAAWSTTSATTNSITLSNLTCGSTYEVALQTICSNTTTSAFSASFTFVTQPCTISCVPPTGVAVSGITTNVAVINWTPMVGGSFLYDIGYRVVGTTNQITIVNVTPPFTIANLTCNTNYEVRVRTNCGNNNYSAWSAFVPFTTQVCPTTCPAPTALTSTNLTATGAVLSWTAASPSPATYNLRYRVSSAASWVTLNNVSTPYQLGNLTCGTSYEWQVQTICANAAGSSTLSAWSSSVYFSTSACTSPCAAPTGLVATNITTNSVNLSWNIVSGAPNYTIRWRPVGTTTWAYVSATTNSMNVANLSCATNYEWQVRANCATGTSTNTNPYSASATFSTLTCPTTCPAPVQLFTTNITGSSAQLNWASAGVPQYRVRYRVNVTGSAWAYVLTTATNAVLSGLTNSTQYVWQVQSICSNTSTTISAPWSLQSYFTTLSANISCPPPTVLNFQPGSTPGSLSVSWPAVPTAVSYTVRYRMAGTTTWTQSGTTNTYLLPITSLTPGAAYEFQIRTVCATSNSAAVTGAWSPSYFYTMPLLLTVYPNPADRAVMVELVSETDGQAMVELRDVFGSLVSTTAMQVYVGMNRIEIPTNSIHEGWYSLTVSTNKQATTTRLLISR